MLTNRESFFMEATRHHYLYVMRFKSNRRKTKTPIIKVGISVNPESRAETLIKNNDLYDLEFLYCIQGTREKIIEAETTLLRHIRANSYKRVRKSFFPDGYTEMFHPEHLEDFEIQLNSLFDVRKHTGTLTVVNRWIKRFQATKKAEAERRLDRNKAVSRYIDRLQSMVRPSSSIT